MTTNTNTTTMYLIMADGTKIPQQVESRLIVIEEHRRLMDTLEFFVKNIEEEKKPFIEKDEFKDSILEILDNVNIIDKAILYRKNGARESIIRIIETRLKMNPSQFGSMMEGFIKTLFKGKDSVSTEHDLIIDGFKVELKSATMKLKELEKGKKVFLYDSIRPSWDYDYLMFCNINFTQLDYYIIKKQDFLKIKLGLNQRRFKNHSVISTCFDKIKDYVIKVNPYNIHKYLK